jgi:predicted Zn-dependent peptidase
MVHRTVLDNGLRLLSEEVAGMPTVTVGVWVESGSRDESRHHNGISHFLEHLFFKGTARRTALQIAQEIDAIGGALDAFTGKEYTCYYTRTLSEHLPLALDLLTDILLYSSFPAEEIERERSVIRQEIAQSEDQPDELIGDLFHLDFWPDHPLSWPITGTLDSVSRLRQDDLLGYRQHHYCPQRVFVSMAGGASHTTLLETLGPVLSSMTGTAHARHDTPPVTRPGVSIHPRELEQTHLSLGVPCVSQTAPEWYAAHLLNSVLGGGISSRLFQEIREKRGLVYDVSSFLFSARDVGYLGIYLSTSPASVPEAMRLTCHSLAEIARSGISADELQRAKSQTRGNLLLDLETSEAWMYRVARCEMCFQRDIPIAEVLEDIEHISLEDVQAVAAECFRPNNLTLTLLGKPPAMSDSQALIAL